MSDLSLGSHPEQIPQCDSLDLGNRLVRMRRIRYQSPVLTVREQIELFEGGLADQHFIAQHQALFNGAPAHNLQDESFREINLVKPSIRILSHGMSHAGKSQPVDEKRRKDTAHSPGVYKSLWLTNPHPVRRQQSSPYQTFIYSVAELDSYSYLTHDHLGFAYLLSASFCIHADLRTLGTLPPACRENITEARGFVINKDA
jgi:hypothetical protein